MSLDGTIFNVEVLHASVDGETVEAVSLRRRVHAVPSLRGVDRSARVSACSNSMRHGQLELPVLLFRAGGTRDADFRSEFTWISRAQRSLVGIGILLAAAVAMPWLAVGNES